MNDKIRNHINIIFAAAPKTAKAAELKEELLINLNDKYEDLLKSGYDSTAAFHIAISGIGDIDELFQACRDSNIATLQQESVASGNEVYIDATKAEQTKMTPLFVALVAMLVFILVIFLFNVAFHFRVVPPVIAAVGLWVVCVGLIVYFLAKSFQNRNTTAFLPDEPTVSSDDDSWQSSAFTNRRIAIGILAILFGVFGVHKFCLGFRNAGLIMLCATVLSFFVLAPVTGILSLVEGIVYLTKSNQEFYQNYYMQKRAWF